MPRLLAASLLVASLCSGTMLHATRYYVDAQQGDDANPGSSADKPWRTIGRVNAFHFQPGDRILLRAGSAWQGEQLRPSSSGKPGSPIVIDCYGEGAMPKLEGQGRIDDVVYLHNVDQIELRDLEITNDAETPALRRGVDIFLDNFGTAKHIVVAGLYIHDIRGTNERKDNGGVLFRTKGDRTPSRFDGLLIERNIVWRVDRSGIAAESYHAQRTRWFPSLHVVIRDNYVEDVGGDGIVPWATKRAIVEHNVVRYGNRRAGSYNAGIWPWSADDTIFQLNEAAFTQTTKDGEGFDSDYNSRNTLFQYNFSHDNAGGFMLICTPVKRDPANNIGNTGTIIRDNVSWNDHSRIFNLSGADNVRVEHNFIYIAAGDPVQALLVSEWDGWSKDALFTANRFYIAGTATWGHEVNRAENGEYRIAPGWGGAERVRFSGNQYDGPNASAHEGSLERIDKAAPQPKPLSGEPVFDPSKDPSQPGRYERYLSAHRRWMLAMLRERLNTKTVRLAK